MTTLALEFSSSQRSVAIRHHGHIAGQARQCMDRSTRCVGLIQDALDQARLKPSDIAAAVVGLGPGSYTGIRMAIALLQGWQLARSIPLFGLRSADAVAHQAWLQGRQGPCTVIVDAQRQQYVRANYLVSSPRPALLGPMDLVRGTEVQAALARGEPLVGPDLDAAFPEITPVYPDAASLLQLLTPDTPSVAAETLEPIYLRATSFAKAPPPRLIPTLPA